MRNSMRGFLSIFTSLILFTSLISAPSANAWSSAQTNVSVFGGSSNDVGYSIAVDSSGNVYTTGYFWGTGDFDPGAGTTNLTSAGSNDVFVSKLDSSGNFVWAKSFGGSAIEYSYSIAVDSSGNVYTTGSFQGTVDFDPGAGTTNLTSVGNSDIFISKLDSSGNFVWVKSFGGIYNESGQSIAVDSSGNVYTTGYFQDTVDFDPGAGTTNLTGAYAYDAFVSKLDSSGNFVWVKSFRGSTYSEIGYSIAVDSSGNVYTTGYFWGTVDFDPGAGTTNLTSAGSNDVFVSKLDSSGNFVWAKSFGGSTLDIGYSIAVDSSGNVYTLGVFRDTADFDPGAGTTNLTSAGINDLFVSKLDSSGALLWVKGFGGSANELSYSIAVDSSGNVYTTGYFAGTVDFDPGAGTTNLTSAGGIDVFILRLSSADNTEANSAPAAPTLNSVAAGDRRVTITFTAGANNGAAITDYEYSLNSGSYTSAGTTTSPFTITGLSGRAAYSVTIKARNSAGLSTASSSLSATTIDSSLDASEAAAAEAARVAAAAAEVVRLAAQAEADRRANEQRQIGDLSSVLPLINELIKEIEDGLKSTSAPKKKSSTSKTQQSSKAKPEKKSNSEPLPIPIPLATEPEAQKQVGELVSISHKVGFGLSASWINSSNIKALRSFITETEESLEVERIVIQGYAQPTKIGLSDIDIARAKAVKKFLSKEGLDYPMIAEGMGQAESKKGDLSRLAVVTVVGKRKELN